MLSEEKYYAKRKEANGDGEEDKHYNRIQTGRPGCGWEWGQYSGDRVAMGTKYFTVSSSSMNMQCCGRETQCGRRTQINGTTTARRKYEYAVTSCRCIHIIACFPIEHWA